MSPHEFFLVKQELTILVLSDAEYYSSVLKASEAHSEMFDLFIEQLNILTKSQ